MADFTDEDDALLEELGVEVETKKDAGRTPREERIIAGFEEIQRFVEQHGHPPQHGEERDIFERLYAVRLDRLRELESWGRWNSEGDFPYPDRHIVIDNTDVPAADAAMTIRERFAL